ncbi:hypothetical protein GQX74_000675, partial [Glossina fuscipes]
MQENLQKPYVEIVEQPNKALRFRYECEGRYASCIPGISSTPGNKTHPEIRIIGYKGPAVVIVSCVTKDEPYRPHPHRLVGLKCSSGIFRDDINEDTMSMTFNHLGIQCVRKKDIEEALSEREGRKVDPFQTGFSHHSIDLSAVRLCFQVYIPPTYYPLAPIVSEPIHDQKSKTDLVIRRLCTCAGSVKGNSEMILLCDKVSKTDIKVRFYEQNTGWTAYGLFEQKDVHKQTAIVFRTPKYHNLNITKPATVTIQLERISDGALSESYAFDYIPLDVVPGYLKQKRQKINQSGGPKYHLMNYGNASVTYLNPINMQCQQQGVNLYAQPEISFDNFGDIHNIASTVQTTNALDNFNQQAQCGGNNLGMNAVFCPQIFNNMCQFNQTAQYNMSLQNAGAANSPMLRNGSQNIAVGSHNDSSQMKVEGLQQILQNQIPLQLHPCFKVEVLSEILSEFARSCNNI